MAITYEQAQNLYNTKLETMTSNAVSWSSFLRQASKFSSYTFDNQVMIQAQRSNPNFVASYEHWNNVQECRVKAGTKGIALFDATSNKLHYVFEAKDVAEIHDNTRNGHKPVAWIAQERHNTAILDRLSFLYPDAEVDSSADFRSQVKEYANYAVSNYFLENEEALDGMADDEKQFIAESVEYSILSRMGLNPTLEDYPTFSEANNFLDVIEEVGAINQQLSYDVLSEIGALVNEYDLAHIQEIGIDAIWGRKHDVYDEFIDYAANKREKENENGEPDSRTNISENRGLLLSESSDGESIRGEDNEIRSSEIELPTGTQTGNAYEDEMQTHSSSALDRSADTSRGENGNINEGTSLEGRSERTTQSEGPDALGTEIQSSTESSGRDRASRNGLRLEYNGAEPKWEQLSLFAIPEVEQIGSIMANGTHSHEEKPTTFGITDEQMDIILRSGGGNENSRSRIYAKYSAHKNPSEMIDFLKAEYQTTGKGFTFDGNPVSVWFNEEGMKLGYGATALETPVSELSWEEIEHGIRNLIENGDYLSSSEAYLVEPSEINRLSSQIYFFFRDGMGENIEDLVSGANYPDSIESLNNALATHEGRNRIAGLISDAKNRLDSGEATLKWKYLKSPEYLLNEIADLDTEKVNYPLKDNVNEIKADFITQDEIDYALSKGSGFSEGKFRIYEHFLEEHDKKENVEFLKHEYGTGGGSGGLPGADDSHNNHDGKGIELAKGGYGHPYAEVMLNWNAVEKRISTLVKEGKYLNAEGIEAFNEYKAEKQRAAFERAQLNLKIDMYRACANDFEDLYQAYKGTPIPQEALDNVLSKHSEDTVKFVIANSILRNESSYDMGMHFADHAKAKEILPDRNYIERIYTFTTIDHNPRNEDGEYVYEDFDPDTFVDFFNQISSNVFKEDIVEEIANDSTEFDYVVLMSKDDALVAFMGEEPEYQIWDYTKKDYIKDSNGESIIFNSEEKANEYLEHLRNNVIDYSSVDRMVVAYGDSYIELHEGTEGFDFSIYDNDYHLVDGGVLDYTDRKINEVMFEVINDFRLPGELKEVLPQESLDDFYEKVDSVAEAEIEAARNGFIQKTSPYDLVVGDCISLDGKNWRITSADSFMVDFENLDPSDMSDTFSLIGAGLGSLTNMNWKHIPEPGAEIRTYEENLRDKVSLAETQVNDLKIDLSEKDAAWEDKYQLWNDAFGTVLLFDKENKEEIIGFDKVQSFVNSLDVTEKEIADIVEKSDYVTELLDNDFIELGESVEIVEAIVDEVARNHDTEPSLVAKQVEEYREANSQEEMDEWHIVHDADDENGNATQWAYKYAENSFIWIDKLEDNTYGVTDSAESDNYLFVTGMLDEAMEMGENYVVEQEIAHVQEMAEIDEAKLSHDLEIEASLPTEARTFIKAENYHITNDTFADGTPSERFNNNVAAIRTLKEIEAESRSATPAEQEILSRYVGWGGLADAFDDRNGETERTRVLKELLTDEEYAAARRSTLDAFYTSPTIIRNIYSALEKMGFEGGSILEPSCGVGNFFGVMPNNLRGTTNVTGVELDSISSRIATQLYPGNTIINSGYEKTSFTNDSFDVAIGNVPFGDFKVNDREYNKENFLIHDYFFAKTLDKVRPGGIVAFITSKGTLDKESENVRRYLAERADLVGAIRLPNTAFRDAAGTLVTSDIIFLQKKDEPITLDENNIPSWVRTSADSNGIEMNSYFVEHPEMICGTMEMVSGPYGPQSTCKANPIIPLDAQLRNIVVNSINGHIDKSLVNLANNTRNESIDNNIDIPPYSYTLVGDDVYIKMDNVITKFEDKPENVERVKALIEIRDSVRDLLNSQLREDLTDEELSYKQNKLNSLYDNFVKKYKRINSRTNRKVFGDDSSLPLLCSLEKYNEDREFVGKADIFTKRTVKPTIDIRHCESSIDALGVTLNQVGRVDLANISSLVGKTEEEVLNDLKGYVFFNPSENKYETAEEYLSGDVVTKLERVDALIAEGVSGLEVNKLELEKVQPEKLKASEISVRLGATWIEPKYYEQFMREVFNMPSYMFRDKWNAPSEAGIDMNPVTNEWSVRGKCSNALTTSTYGTQRKNALEILDDSLNLKDSVVKDRVENADGTYKYVTNQQETAIALQKQEILKEKFNDWIFSDPERRDYLVNKYNTLFNRTKARNFNGDFLTFNGMANGITLKKHQKDAIARTLFNDQNTLLAHVVGAGKTWEMAASAMESKRLGLCTKSMIVVPNHLLEQWGNDFYRLYPNANLLVATKEDLKPDRRKEFCSRIATGNYDAVIISHSQFEKIPISQERQEAAMRKEIDEVVAFLDEAKLESGKNKLTIKALERTKKSLEERLNKLLDTPKDDVVTFEQLGIDKLYVDESHKFKNLLFYTKMNVAGLGSRASQRSQDMLNKCMYLDEVTGGKGVVFATGTPISNSMTELYTIMRFLQNKRLHDLNLHNFDAWASTFGETVTQMELKAEGSGYQAKTRFAKFFNLPELMSLFKESADIKTSDELNLDVPENINFVTVECERSDFQKAMIDEISERATRVRNGMVDPSIDNMLNITNDGRKLALDQRLMNPMLPDDDKSKTSVCVNNVFDIWQKTASEKSTQLIFCDLATPGDGLWSEDKKYDFNVYDDIKRKLMDKGVPANEIRFIHEATTDTAKDELFKKVRKGEVRVLIGSTEKMGAGTNVQTKLVALHHIDVPWRPSDIEQREGRIIRQGNQNNDISIFKYATKDTFDAYSWQLIENKQKFIGQIMTSKSPMRSADDMDAQALNYAEIKALCTSNPLIKEKMDLDVSVTKLKALKSNYQNNIYNLQDDIRDRLPKKINILNHYINGCKKDLAVYQEAKAEMLEKYKDLAHNDSLIEGLDFVKGEDIDTNISEPFAIKIGFNEYTDRNEAGLALIELCSNIKTPDMDVKVGEFCGMKLTAKFNAMTTTFNVTLHGENAYTVELSNSPVGNMQRIKNKAEKIADELSDAENRLSSALNELEIAKQEVEKPFPKEEELLTKVARLTEVNRLLEQIESGELKVENGEIIYSDELPEEVEMDIQELAENIDKFMKELDPYEYADNIVGSPEEQVENIAKDLRSGNVDHIKEYLEEVIEFEDGTSEDIAQAKKLLSDIDNMDKRIKPLFTKDSLKSDLAEKKAVEKDTLSIPSNEKKQEQSL